MLDYIIKHFSCNSRYINEIEKLMDYLDSKNMDNEEKASILLDVYNYNLKVLSKIKEENKKLQQVSAVESLPVVSKELPLIEDELITIDKKTNTTTISVSNYIKKIKEIDNIDSIIGILPSEDIENSKDIINVIILKLVEEIVEIKKLLHQERHNIDSETREYFENEVKELQLKINYIREITNFEDCDVIEESDFVNDLVFLSTSMGNVCAYQDLKDIPNEAYDSFITLLDSIRTGKFTNLRAFNNNESLKDLREVKYNRSRIVFKQIANNCYAIIYMFIKKVDKDAYYHTSLVNRNELFLQNADEMTFLANSSEDYLEENRVIMDDIYNILGSKNKVKKVGDING